MEIKKEIRNVALYLRKSRGDEDKDLDKHRTKLVDMCNTAKWKYIEYVEIGNSDSIEMRPKFKQLLNDVRDGIYDAVCVVDYDRLSRGDLGEQDKVKKAFQKEGTLIITPDKIYDLNNDLDDTYADFKGMFARQEYKIITKRLQQGKKMGSRRGDWTNGIPPFPYEYQRYKDKYNERGLVINDEKLVMYNEIIKEALNGLSPQQIAWKLNEKGYISPRGKSWNGVGVYRILVDETHLGKIISNKSEGDGHRIKKENAKKIKLKPRDEWVIVDNCHAPTKTQEEHDKISELLQQRKMLPSREKAFTYSLSGLIKCGKCGCSHSFLKKDNDKIFIKPCWHKDEFGKKCGNRGTSQYDNIEMYIIEEIRKYRDKLLFGDTGSNSETINLLQDELKLKERELDKYNKTIDRINDSYDVGDYSRSEWIERKERWNGVIKKCKDEIAILKKKLNSNKTIKKDAKVKLLNEVLTRLKEATSHEDRNEIFRIAIDKITWYRDGEEEGRVSIRWA